MVIKCLSCHCTSTMNVGLLLRWHMHLKCVGYYALCFKQHHSNDAKIWEKFSSLEDERILMKKLFSSIFHQIGIYFKEKDVDHGSFNAAWKLCWYSHHEPSDTKRITSKIIDIKRWFIVISAETKRLWHAAISVAFMDRFCCMWAIGIKLLRE